MCTFPKSLTTETRLLGIFLSLLFVVTIINDFEIVKKDLLHITEEQARRTHFAIVNDFMKDRKKWTTSILGSWLFKYDTWVWPQNRTFLVYVDRHQPSQKNVLEGCSVKNCNYTGQSSKISQVDAVLVHLQRGIISKDKDRNTQQRWIFLSDEAPTHTFSLSRKRVYLKDFANVFNWSMTYRSDTDIPKPYGRTVPLDEPVFKKFDTSVVTEIIPNWYRKRRDVLVTILVSSCRPNRVTLLKRLKKYIPVDVYGRCSDNKTLKYICPGYFRKDCDRISEYLFYLSLENSECREYMTEKIWYNAYLKGAIPIIMGPSLSDCKRLLPPDSFLYLSSNDVANVEKLAKYIIQLSEDEDLLLSLHNWRNHFVVINEHGYFGRKTSLLCRVCEGLNYNDEGQKIYSEQDIRWFLDSKLSCGRNNVFV